MTWVRVTRQVVAWFAWLAVIVAPSFAHAGAPDADASRIAAAGRSVEWNWTPPGQSDRYGHAETLINAPVGAVRAQVLDFRRYREMLPEKFKSSRVVGHEPDGSADVYLQIAVLHGMVMLWDVTRFGPVQRTSAGVEVVEGRMVPGKGNIDALNVVWTMRALDAEWTLLKCDLLLKPGLPAPQSAIDEELRDSARYAVDAIHDRAQGSASFVPWPG
jgi:hypothetical protein